MFEIFLSIQHHIHLALNEGSKEYLLFQRAQILLQFFVKDPVV